MGLALAQLGIMVPKVQLLSRFPSAHVAKAAATYLLFPLAPVSHTEARFLGRRHWSPCTGSRRRRKADPSPPTLLPPSAPAGGRLRPTKGLRHGPRRHTRGRPSPLTTPKGRCRQPL